MVFEIKKEYVEAFQSKLAQNIQTSIFQQKSFVKQVQQSIFDLQEVAHENI
jgi:hypothetical protein